MQFVEAGVPLSFEVTFDSPSLFVGMAVYDDSGASPAFVSMVPMVNWYGNSYRAKFTATAGKGYLFNKAVYTDGTYAVLDPSYSQGSESIRADDLAGLFLNAVLASYQIGGSVGKAIFEASQGGGGGASNVIGAVLQAVVLTPTIVGVIETPDNIGGCP